MTIETTIKQSTCEVTKSGQQLGSCFWTENNNLLTASHVVEPVSDSEVYISTQSEKKIKCSIAKLDTELDLAMLKPDEIPGNTEKLSIDADVPPIGEEVIWSGFAEVFGENQIDRQRFGWGHVASEKFERDAGIFFEVDGLFNPGHSGGPVVSKKSGNVVGVVSASAGSFEEIISEWKEIDNLLFYARDLSDLHSFGLHCKLRVDDPKEAAKMQTRLDKIGVEYDTSSHENGDVTVKFDRIDIVDRMSELVSDMSEILLDTAHGSFQMGLGVASGGQAIEQIIE